MNKEHVIGQMVTDVQNHWGRRKVGGIWQSVITNVVITLENGTAIQPVADCDLVVSPPTVKDRRRRSRGLPFTFTAKLLHWQMLKDSGDEHLLVRGKAADSPFGRFAVRSFSELSPIVWTPWVLHFQEQNTTVDSLKAGQVLAQQLFNDQLQEIAKYMEAVVIEYSTPEQTF